MEKSEKRFEYTSPLSAMRAPTTKELWCVLAIIVGLSVISAPHCAQETYEKAIKAGAGVGAAALEYVVVILTISLMWVAGGILWLVYACCVWPMLVQIFNITRAIVASMPKIWQTFSTGVISFPSQWRAMETKARWLMVWLIVYAGVCIFILGGLFYLNWGMSNYIYNHWLLWLGPSNNLLGYMYRLIMDLMVTFLIFQILNYTFIAIVKKLKPRNRCTRDGCSCH